MKEKLKKLVKIYIDAVKHDINGFTYSKGEHNNE